MDPKPGWQTTEFWLSLATSVITVLVVTGLLKPTDQNKIAEAVNGVITSIFAVVAHGAVVYKYIHERSAIKKAGKPPT